jgi:release factor glutamine methyltransferase
MSKSEFTLHSHVRRGEGGPLDYIRGFSEFLGCKIDLSQKPMIPRPETEFWLKKAIKSINRARREVVCLDIFAGSGCIGIAVLKNCPELCREAVFGEIDKNLVKQIKLNLKINKIPAKRYKVIQSDIFEKIKEKSPHLKFKCGDKYDYIFANPPYVAKKRKHLVQKSVLDFEPYKALFGGKDGMFFINKFLKDAKKYLNKNGKIYLEFDSFQKKMIEKLLKQFRYKEFKFYKDQFRKWRWVAIEN